MPPRPSPPLAPADGIPATPRSQFAAYFWFVLKNVIGWILMLSALPVGIAVPGPGGFPLFILGFALVTFPGKRRLTARVMRGRRIDPTSATFTFFTTIFSLLLTVVITWLLVARYGWAIEKFSIRPSSVIGLCALAAAITWFVTRLGLQFANVMIRGMPRLRRYIRPWLRKRGFNLLPPRRKRLAVAIGASPAGTVVEADEQEILHIDERHHNRIRAAWALLKPWLRRAASLAITILIFLWIFQPIRNNWPAVRDRLTGENLLRFMAGIGMFAVFLFAFRALAWRQVLIGFGHRLPIAPATRIWSISELARYIPGAIWQVVGRMHLVKPYGVSGSISSTSQVLEITTFLLANVIVASCCMLYFGVRQVDGAARAWLFIAMALIPALALLLHPRVYYGAANRVLRALGRPVITQRPSGRRLTLLLAWACAGLLWQGMAVWVVTADYLHLPAIKWWVVTGAYCLSWFAGFLAVWAPGGIGVREVVFMTIMLVVLPPTVRAQFEDGSPDGGTRLEAFLAFLSVLLRLWATLGELVLCALAIAADPQGTLGQPDAPGRITSAAPPRPATTRAQVTEISLP